MTPDFTTEERTATLILGGRQVSINGVIIAAGVAVLSLGTDSIGSGSKLNSRLPASPNRRG